MHFKVLFMSQQQESLQELKHIKQMMERSSRFISLSGLSGIMAGLCAIVGAYFADNIIHPSTAGLVPNENYQGSSGFNTVQELLKNQLFMIAVYTFTSAFILAFLYTYLRSRKTAVPLWGTSSRRLLFAVALPMIAGGIYLLKIIQLGNYGLIAPGCLIFYGLALVNGSKYTLGEVKYLGYLQILLGILSCWIIGYGLYFWALGFGILHILYGVIMWYKYERK